LIRCNSFAGLGEWEFSNIMVATSHLNKSFSGCAQVQPEHTPKKKAYLSDDLLYLF
jgi:hypothetical protein